MSPSVIHPSDEDATDDFPSTLSWGLSGSSGAFRFAVIMRAAPTAGIFFFLLCFILSCAPRIVVRPSPEELLVYQALLQKITERKDQIRSLTGMARVVVRTRGQGWLTAEEVIRLQAPDSLRLETLDPMGGLQILMISVGNEGLLKIPGQSKAFHFSSDRKGLKRYLGINLSAPELLQIVAGTPPLSGIAPDQILTRLEDDATVVQVYQKNRLVQRFWIASSDCIVRWERLNARGEALEELHFEDFRLVEGIAMPFLITFKGAGGDELVLRYRSLFLNREIEPRLFDLHLGRGES